MKKSDLNKMLGLIDDKYLDEANPSKKRASFWANKSLFMKIGAVAACFLLVLNVVLLPLALTMGSKINKMEDELENKDNLIEDILDKLERPHTQNYYELNLGQLGGTPSKITISSPQTVIPSGYEAVLDTLESMYDSSIFDEGWGDLSDAIDGELEESTQDKIEDLENGNWQDGSDSYEETTDLQEKGVIEGDIIKRTSKHIYHLNGDTLAIYTIAGEDSRCVGSVSLERITGLLQEKLCMDIYGDEREAIEKDYDKEAKEMFLSKDGKIATIVVNDSFFVYGERTYSVPYVALIALNVEDPQDIYVSNISTLFGAYESARVIDDEIFVFTKHSARRQYLAIPQYSDGEGFVHFENDSIYIDEATSNSYMLLYRLNEKSLKVNDARAYLSYTGDIYVSNNNIYLTKEYTAKDSNEKKTVTDILRVRIGDKAFEKGAYATIDGYLKDRYSLSEYNGFLRAVTTTDGQRYDENGKLLYRYATNANLYVLQADNMARVNAVYDFAPDGETVRSVKFKGANVYVCTSIETQDPVFFFNLSNVYNITVKDTGTIPGFSTSLIDFGDDLLGVGVDGNRNFKLEAYREVQGGVESVCYQIINGYYSDEYKAYYINREMGLFGLGIYDNNEWSPNRYILFRYDGEKFIEVVNVAINGNRDLMRAVLVGDYFYIITNNQFKVVHTPPSAFGLI